MSIFKAYDIRGIYPSEVNEETAYLIGRAFVDFLGCRNVVVGRDMRGSSAPLFAAVSQGIIEQGADVIDIGMCSTPMSYYANGRLAADASIMITASHNPGEYNGFKICRGQAVPISGATGIKEIERLVNERQFVAAKVPGKRIEKLEMVAEYVRHIKTFVQEPTTLKLVVDCANAVGVFEMRVLEGVATVIPLFDELDGSFPNHEANPLKTETLAALRERVVAEKADLGVSFDGDADRAGFVDETGQVIPMDLVTALIAKDILVKKGQQTILYDLRSSQVVREVIEENHGRAVECRVGHAFIKQMMREYDACFAGELSGHYYFKDNYTTESSALAVVSLLNLMQKTGKKISELVLPLRKYYQSGEINSRVLDANKILAALEKKYFDGKFSKLDGLKIVFSEWWFNVRGSNTEPLLRLNLEANTEALMLKKRDEILQLIRG
jgi:phosphomannomutase